MSSSVSSQHAVLPAQAPPPFPEPLILSARRIPGLVLTPPHKAAGDNNVEQSLTPVTTLERRASVAGNILLIQIDSSSTKAFMLQRKIKNTMFGSIRVGYALKDRNPNDDDDAYQHSGTWEVSTNGDGIYDDNGLVAVTVEDKARVLNHHGSCNTAQDPKSELSALQMVAALDPQGEGHVVGTNLIASDDLHVYTITPYYKEGSLFEYCMGMGTLNEMEARFFFRQILKGLNTLQDAELCHRDLNLQNILLRGSHCSILGLACAIRIPTEPESSVAHMIEPQPPCASNPQTVAPELLQNHPFDGYAVDLWAAGIMLFIMLLGAEALFSAPIMEDRKFKAICEGNLRFLIGTRNTGTQNGEPQVPISDSAIDLLQQMLRSDPMSRPTLAQVLQHPWVVEATNDGSEVIPRVPLRPIGFGGD